MNIVYNANAISILEGLENSSVDHIIIDPPYEIDFQMLDWDKPCLNWTLLESEFNRIIKPNGNLLIFQGWSNVCSTIKMFSAWNFNNWIIYDRIKGRGAKRNFTSTREDLLWFSIGAEYTFNKEFSNIKKKTGGLGAKNGQENRSLSNVWTDISPIVPWSKERVKHPTQKPLQLMERIIRIFTNENELILDCFAGSGTTLVACKNYNRKYIGVEKDHDYFQICNNRLNNIC